MSPSYIIIGAGVFGTSTALHLKSQYPNAEITLLDRDDPDAPTRPAASWDWNKVVRADYREITYCKLALEAQDPWCTNPLWRPFYHESGVYWISRTNLADKVLENFHRLGRKADLHALPVSEARRLYGGIFDHADYDGVEKVLINKTSGWAAAKDALLAGIKAAVGMGVRYLTAEVEGLEFDGDRCVGVRTGDGVVSADRTVLCTGAFTPVLLEKAAADTGREEFRPQGRMIAAGAITGLVSLDKDMGELLEKMPVCIQENPTHGGTYLGTSNGTLPPHESELKFWGQSIVKYVHGNPPFSRPPAGHDYDQWTVPQALRADIDVANQATFGKRGEGWRVHSYRMCWDCVTPSEDFIISPHPASSNLYIATCGSFHGWKFLPVIGRYVVQMLDGTLDADLVKRWAWDRELPEEPGSQWPRRDLAEYLDD